MMDSSRDIVRRLRENRMLQERKNYEEMDHKDLVKLAQDGDQLAFEVLTKEYDPSIEKAASKFIFDSGDSEDAKQIATIGFWEAVQKWEGTGSFGAYANMIMHRKLTDQLRKDSAGKELIHSQSASLDAPVASDDEGGELSLGATMSSSDLSPEEQYLGKDGAMKITKFLRDELSDMEKKVILLYIEGYKVSEIAKEEDMKYKTVENAIKRVKDKLADYLRNVRESKKIKLSEESIFSDEEKQILKSVLGKLEKRATIRESLGNKSVEEYTEKDFEDSLSDIEDEAEDIRYDIQNTTSEEYYHDLLSRVEELKDKIIRYEDYIESEELVKRYKEVYKLLSDTEYLDPENLDLKPRDHYAEVGMSRSDF